MSRKGILTEIVQYKVNILSAEDWDGYEKNNPGDKWELVEVVGADGNTDRFWTANYNLAYPPIVNKNEYEIVRRDNGKRSQASNA